jgi:hypothetical protein
MRAVVIADLHVGSRVGLCNVKSKCVPGGDAAAPIRAAIYDKWVEATQGPWAKPDVLFFLGDAIEGQNKKGFGFGTWTTDLLEQCDMAADLIRMWKARQVYMVRGSGYHVEVGGGLQCEEYIGRELESVPVPSQDKTVTAKPERSGWHWYVTLGGVTFHLSHKVGISTVFHYKSTPTAREMLYAKLNDQLRHEVGGAKTSVILRAHAHYYNLVEYSSTLGVVCPCWKGLDDFAMKMGAIALSPDLGYLGFECKDGERRMERHLFQLTDVQKPPHVVA